MKRFIYIILGLSLLAIPVVSYANITTTWQAASSTATSTFPTPINGNNLSVTAPFFTATTSTSTFKGVVSPCFATTTTGPCITSGSGGGSVSSVSNSDGTLTVSPTTGSVVASLNLGHNNNWTGQQNFNLQSGFGMAAPNYPIDIYDNFATGFDIGDSLTGLWSIDDIGNANLQSTVYPFAIPGNPFGQFTWTDGSDQTTLGAINPANGDYMYIYSNRLANVFYADTGGFPLAGVYFAGASPATAWDVGGDITDEGEKNAVLIGTDSTGKFIPVATSSLGLNFFKNVAASTTLSTGSNLLAGLGTFGGIISTGTLRVIGQTTLATASSTGLTVTSTSTLTGLRLTNLSSTFAAIDSNGNFISTTTPGFGTVTSITCGTGLSGGTITTTGTCTNAGVLSVGGLTGTIATSSLNWQNPITLTTTGTSGAASFNSTTGALNIPNYTAGGSGNSAFTIGNGVIYNATSSDEVNVGSTSSTTATFFVQGSTTNPTRDIFDAASSSGSTTFAVRAGGTVCIGTNTCTDSLTVSNTVATPRFTIGPGSGTNSDAVGNFRSLGTGNAYMVFTKHAVADEYHFGWNNSNSNWEFGTGGTMGSGIDQTVNSSGVFNFLNKTGFGSSTPNSTVAIQAAANVNPLMVASSSLKTVFEIDQYGHKMTGGVAPSCGMGCSSVTGDDNVMEVVSGSTVTAVTVTFAQPWKNAAGTLITPICSAQEGSGGVIATDASSTPTTVTINLASSITSLNIGVQCEGSNNFTQ